MDHEHRAGGEITRSQRGANGGATGESEGVKRGAPPGKPCFACGASGDDFDYDFDHYTRDFTFLHKGFRVLGF